MDKKYIIICENSPFPPKDGVSVAINSLITHLKCFGELYIYVLNEETIYNQNSPIKISLNTVLNKNKFDAIFTSPIGSSLKVLNLDEAKGIKKIAFLSDCYTYVLWRQISLLLRFNPLGISKFPVIFLKIIYYYLKENKVAKKYDLIILQTPKDVSIFNKIFSVKNTISLPNIPNLTLSKRIRNKAFKKIGFVATFNSSYSIIANWFVLKVWREIIQEHPEAKLHLLGSGSKEFSEKYRNENYKSSIVVEDYHENLSDFYEKVDVSVSPIFKGYGLINKTIESMSYGCIVIGDKEAFNGIEGVENKVNCMIANNHNQFIEAINYIFESDDEIKNKIRIKGEEIIFENFNFEKDNVKLKKHI